MLKESTKEKRMKMSFFRNRNIRGAAVWLLLAVLLGGIFAACAKTEESAAPANLGLVTGKGNGAAQSAAKPAEPENSPESADDREPETAAVEEPEETAAAEPMPGEIPAAEMRPMTEEELTALENSLTFEENGFFVCSYDRPEEIVWNEVFYNGAGIRRDPTEDEIADYEHWNGEIYTDLEVLSREDVERFVLEKTGTEYRAARKPLDWYCSDDYDVYMFQHGDTNYQEIRFTAGETNGTDYRLWFRMSDWANYRWDCPYVMTARILDGNWQYISNLPADRTAPVTLLTVEYFRTQEEIADQVLTHTTEIRRLESDEDSPRYWVVITAQEDGVRVSLDRDHTRSELESMNDFRWQTPDENLDSFVLNRGEKAAFQVNMPWNPCIRLAAFCGAYFGQYWFGEDNWLHLWDDEGVPLDYWITGHDYDGEGRGCSYEDEVGLVGFLSAGDWFFSQNENEGAAAAVTFEDYRTMWVENEVECYQIFLRFGQDDNARGEAPNLLIMEKYDNQELVWETVPLDGDALGTYRIEAVQLDGEQLLTFTETEGGDGGSGVLSYLFPDYDETVRSFTLRRYIGAKLS